MAMTEAQIQKNIKTTCTELGFSYYHTRNSFASDKGFPDVVVGGPILYPVATMFYETKGPRGKVEDLQVMWLRILRASGHTARLIYESAAQMPGRYPDLEADLGTVYDDLAAAFARSLERRQRSE